MESLPATSVEAKDLRYCTTQNYPVKINRATISLEPVADGKLLSFAFTACTDQAIPGGEMLLDLLCEGVQFHTERYNLSDGVPCPIARGNFELGFSQVLPVGVTPGNYSIKLKVINQDGRALSWVALDFTIPRDPPIGGRGGRGRGGRGRGEPGGRGGRGGRVMRGRSISFPSRDGRGPIITLELVNGVSRDMIDRGGGGVVEDERV